MLKTRWLAAFCLTLGLLASRQLMAEDKATDVISTKATVLLRIKNPEGLLEKAASFVDAVQPGLGKKVRQQAPGMGMVIDNPTLAGVDKTQDWYVAIFIPPEVEGKSTKEEPVFIVPLLKGKEDDLQKALGDSYQFVRKGSWGVYTKDKGAFAEVQKLVKGEGKSIATLIDDSSSKVFDGGDLSIFLNLAELVADHKDDFDKARKELAKGLEEAGQNAQEVPGINVKAAIQLGGKILNSLIQGAQDSQSCVIALKVDKQGISFEDLVRFKEGSSAEKFLSTVPPAAMNPLSQLPGGHQIYYGLHFDVSKMISVVGEFMGAPPAGQEKATAELKELIAELGKLKFGTMAGAVKTGSMETGVIQVAGVAEVDAPDKVRSLLQKMYKVLGEIKTGKIKQTYKIEEEAEKYGANSADVLTVTTTTEDPEDSVGKQVQQIMKILYGPEGAQTRVVYLKDRVVQSLGGGKQAMADALQGQTGSASGTSVANARAKLGTEANALFLIDLPNLIKNVALMLSESGALGGIQIPAKVIQEVKLKESYLGASLATESRAIRSRLYLPVEQIQGLLRLAISTGAIPAEALNGGGGDAKDDDDDEKKPATQKKETKTDDEK